MSSMGGQPVHGKGAQFLPRARGNTATTSHHTCARAANWHPTSAGSTALVQVLGHERAQQRYIQCTRRVCAPIDARLRATWPAPRGVHRQVRCSGTRASMRDTSRRDAHQRPVLGARRETGQCALSNGEPRVERAHTHMRRTSAAAHACAALGAREWSARSGIRHTRSGIRHTRSSGCSVARMRSARHTRWSARSGIRHTRSSVRSSARTHSARRSGVVSMQWDAAHARSVARTRTALGAEYDRGQCDWGAARGAGGETPAAWFRMRLAGGSRLNSSGDPPCTNIGFSAPGAPPVPDCRMPVVSCPAKRCSSVALELQRRLKRDLSSCRPVRCIIVMSRPAMSPLLGGCAAPVQCF